MAVEGLQEITEVVETSSHREANEFLSRGWKLIDTYKTSSSVESNDESLIYVLGKNTEKTPSI